MSELQKSSVCSSCCFIVCFFNADHIQNSLALEEKQSIIEDKEQEISRLNKLFEKEKARVAELKSVSRF